MRRPVIYCFICFQNFVIFDLNIQSNCYKKIVNTKNYNEHFKHHYTNVKLLKIISGDNSDNIKGIKGVSEKTLIKYFPKITQQTLTLEDIFSKIELIQNERKTRLKTLDNITT